MQANTYRDRRAISPNRFENPSTERKCRRKTDTRSSYMPSEAGTRWTFESESIGTALTNGDHQRLEVNKVDAKNNY
jgi:hypothetical protein